MKTPKDTGRVWVVGKVEQFVAEKEKEKEKAKADRANSEKVVVFSSEEEKVRAKERENIAVVDLEKDTLAGIRKKTTTTKKKKIPNNGKEAMKKAHRTHRHCLMPTTFEKEKEKEKEKENSAKERKEKENLPEKEKEILPPLKRGMRTMVEMLVTGTCIVTGLENHIGPMAMVTHGLTGTHRSMNLPLHHT